MSEPDKIKQAFVATKKGLSDLSHEVTGLRAQARNWKELYYREKERGQQAALYEARANEFEEKASRTDALELACQDLIDALDRLPVAMEDAAVLQMAIAPDIPLYGTHEWQAVMTAKHILQAKKGRPE